MLVASPPCRPACYVIDGCVQESIYDKFAEAVADRVSKFRLGSGLENGVTLGPLITHKAVKGVSVCWEAQLRM